MKTNKYVTKLEKQEYKDIKLSKVNRWIYSFEYPITEFGIDKLLEQWRDDTPGRGSIVFFYQIYNGQVQIYQDIGLEHFNNYFEKWLQYFINYAEVRNKKQELKVLNKLSELASNNELTEEWLDNNKDDLNITIQNLLAMRVCEHMDKLGYIAFTFDW